MHVICILILNDGVVQYFVFGNVNMVMFITVPSESKVKSFTWTHKINGPHREKNVGFPFS